MKFVDSKVDVIGRDGRRIMYMRDMIRHRRIDLATGEDKDHFRVTMASATTVQVHGGRWTHHWGLERTSLPLTIDSGTSAVYAGYKTLTISETCWVMLGLNNYGPPPTTPTTVTASVSATYPTSEWYQYWPVAYVTFAGGAITNIEQLWLGDINTFCNWTSNTAGGTVFWDSVNPSAIISGAAARNGGTATQLDFTFYSTTLTIAKGRLDINSNPGTQTFFTADCSTLSVGHAGTADSATSAAGITGGLTGTILAPDNSGDGKTYAWGFVDGGLKTKVEVT